MSAAAALNINTNHLEIVDWLLVVVDGVSLNCMGGFNSNNNIIISRSIY